MAHARTDDELTERLREARAIAREGRVDAALQLLLELQRQRVDSAEVAIAIARLSASDAERALSAALAARPDNEVLAVELAVWRASEGRLPAAASGLRAFVECSPVSPLAWLVLGQLHEDTGYAAQALVARFEALKHANALGVWQDPATTPLHVASQVRKAVRSVLQQPHVLCDALLEPLRQQHGARPLQRIDKALRSYLRVDTVAPPDVMQRPRVLYVPDVPTEPFLDPELQPWAQKLRAAFADVRAEALSVLLEGVDLEAFIKVQQGDRIGNYLGGLRPSWDAFFFYRHGLRYDNNHLRCPRTSALLESIELARIPGQTPEVCFSVLAPGTHILPHHGVTNARTVMHLPLAVPAECALHLVDRGTHHWVEGEPVMFDDTFLHEAWNRSESLRVILLMDCWNPHLTAVERAGVATLSQAIAVLDVAYAASPWLAD